MWFFLPTINLFLLNYWCLVSNNHFFFLSTKIWSFLIFLIELSLSRPYIFILLLFVPLATTISYTLSLLLMSNGRIVKWFFLTLFCLLLNLVNRFINYLKGVLVVFVFATNHLTKVIWKVGLIILVWLYLKMLLANEITKGLKILSVLKF